MNLPGFEDIPGLTQAALDCANEFTIALMHWNQTGNGRLGRFTPEEPAVSARFEKYFKLTGSEIRGLIQYLRRTGHPVGANSGGYFWAATRAELAQTIESMEGRAISIQRTADALREIDFGAPQEKKT